MRVGLIFVPVLAALFALPVLATAAHHEQAGEPKAWVGEEVAALAQKLGKHAEDMRQAVRKQAGTESLASGQSRATEALIDDLRGLRVECNKLRKEAERGKSREDTENLFRRINEIHRDAAEELRRMFLSEANLARVKEGRALLEALRLYYTGTVDTRPDLVEPQKGEGEEKEE